MINIQSSYPPALTIPPDLLSWLLESGEPWTRYRTLVDLLWKQESDWEVQAARADMITHPKVQELSHVAASWPNPVLRRHNDASHSLYCLSTLADFGLKANDLDLQPAITEVFSHQSNEGAFQSLVNIPRAFGGTGEDQWAWILCDSPTLLYSVIAMGLGQDERVYKAVCHLENLVQANGYRCAVSPELGKFKGPGRRSDPCPIANLYALKVLSLLPDRSSSQAAKLAAEALLSHWEHRQEFRPFLFGMGTDFRKIKYPYVWYDILHVVEVLSRFPFALTDQRFTELAHALFRQSNQIGRYTAGSMYKAWKGWSFADKKNPSPWLTVLVWRIKERTAGSGWLELSPSV